LRKLNLALVLMLFTLAVGLPVLSDTYAASQDQPGVIKTSVQVTARKPRPANQGETNDCN